MSSEVHGFSENDLVKANNSGWKSVPLGVLCKFINGNAYRESDWHTEGQRIVRIQNLNDQSKPFNLYAGDPSNRVRIVDGDLLIAWSGTPGTSFGAHLWSRGPALLNQHIFRADVKVPETLHKPWAVQAINYHLNILIQKAHGGVGLRHVTKGEIEKLEIPLPPLAEQKRIAAILNEQMATVERAREAAESRISSMISLRESFLNSCFSLNDKSRSPIHERIKLGDVCVIDAQQVNPTNPSFASLPHVSGENIESGRGTLINVRSAAEDKMTSGKYLFPAHCVLYSKLRPYLRKAAMPSFEGLCSADMYPVLPNQERVLAPYLMWLLLSRDFTKYADDESRRARMPKLNRDQFFAYRTWLPPLHEQQQVGYRLSRQMQAIEYARTAACEQLYAIKKLPAALLRRAFRGEL